MEGGYKNKGNRHWFPRYEAWARNTCKEEAKIVVKLDIKDRRDKTFDLTKKRALRVQGICVVSTTVKIFLIVAVVTVLAAVILILTNYSYSKESLENL